MLECNFHLGPRETIFIVDALFKPQEKHNFFMQGFLNPTAV